MTEPDVTLTDYALALECAVFCVFVARWPWTDARVRRSWVILFASIGLGSLFGGTVHGFFNDPRSVAGVVLWLATLLSLGMTSTAMWMIGSYMELGEPVGTWVRRAAIAQLFVYATVVLFVTNNFVVAIAAYLPATVFLLIVFATSYRRTPSGPLASGVAGLALTFVAAAVQQLRIAIHPVYFNHNALYHLIQAVALLLLFFSARQLGQGGAASGESVRGV